MHPIIRPIVAIVGLMVAMGTAVATPRPVWVMGSEVLGETGDDGVAVFKGIPYAQAPVGRWRWRSPQPLTRLPSPFWAKAWMPACPQSDSNTRWYRSVAERIDPNHGAVSVQAPPTMSEDCLGLNVWVPPHSPTDGPMAVLVWIHGGGHRDGYAYEPNYEGAALAKRGQLIVVSIAYRLNVLGFLPPRISNAPDLPLGMQDELAALTWIHAHIAAFGGDPQNVTIAGESAGAADVGELWLEPKAQRLFTRAISQSGGFFLLDHYRRAQAVARSKRFYRDHFQTLDPSALRGVPADELVAFAARDSLDAAYRPPRADQRRSSDPAWRLQSHAIRHDLLVGSNQDEWWMYLQSGSMTRSAYMKTFPKPAQQLLSAIGADIRDPAASLDAVYSLLNFHCPVVLMADAVAAPNHAYVYRFAQVRQGAQRLGSYHGAEIPYVFNRHDPWLPTSPEDRQLSVQMMDYWAAFAKTGNPNGASVSSGAFAEIAPWPQYTRAHPQWMYLQSTPTPQEATIAPLCRRLWPWVYRTTRDYGAD